MSILLINPQWVKREGNISKDIASCMPPLGLAQIASFLEERFFKVEILDVHAERIGLDKIYQHINDKQPWFIGITATTSIINNTMEIARLCKRFLPQTKIVLGGVHPTVLPDEVLSNESVDFVIRGEGEYTFWELARGDDIREIPGLSYKSNGVYIHNEARALIENLDSLPYPAYHLLPMHRYYPTLGAYKRLPAISMVATRGCPGRCTFCYGGVLGEKIRRISPRRLVDEIRLLKDNYGIKEIQFYDDTFTVFKDEVKEFCTLLLSENIDITWSCFARVDYVDKDMLRIMKDSGCHQVMFGIESADEGILKNINKRINLNGAEEAIALTKKLGMDVRATFMLGNPGETLETMEKTIQFAIKTSPDVVVFNITTPYPGTKMFNWAKECGYLNTLDWEKYDLSHPVMNLPTVSSEMVLRYYQDAYRRFYLLLPYLCRRLLRFFSWTEVKMNISAFKRIWSNPWIKR